MRLVEGTASCKLDAFAATHVIILRQALKLAPLLAVPFGTNAVGIYNSSVSCVVPRSSICGHQRPALRRAQGQPLDPANEGLVKNIRACEAIKLAWHPYLPLLAVGWKDGIGGCVLLYSCRVAGLPNGCRCCLLLECGAEAPRRRQQDASLCTCLLRMEQCW
jgi:hypothetical protein